MAEPSVGRGQGPSLAADAQALLSENPEVRRVAIERLGHLPPDRLTEISERIVVIGRHRPPPNWAFDIFRDIRRAAAHEGTEADEETLDLVPGIGPVLRANHTRWYGQVAEMILLWRSLERIGTYEATVAMYPLIYMDGQVSQWISTRVVRRMGAQVMAAVIAGRDHDDHRVRLWSRRNMRRLGADNPGQVVQSLSDAQLADVLRAYGELRFRRALPVIASYLGHRSRRVRRAARQSMASYGSSGVWALRTAYRNRMSEHAPAQWDASELLAALCTDYDQERLAPVREAMEVGTRAHERREWNAMDRAFADVLARNPEIDNSEPLALGYADRGRAALDAEPPNLDAAINAYRRALRLAPEHHAANGWRAQVAYAEAEQLRSRHDIFDVYGYESALALAPEHSTSLARLDDPAAGRETPPTDPHWWLLALSLLLVVIGFASVRGYQRTPTSGETADTTLSELTETTFDTQEATIVDP